MTGMAGQISAVMSFEYLLPKIKERLSPEPRFLNLKDRGVIPIWQNTQRRKVTSSARTDGKNGIKKIKKKDKINP